MSSDSAFAWGYAHAQARNTQDAVEQVHLARDGIHQANEVIVGLNVRVLAAEAAVARLTEISATSAMDLAGLIAQFDAFKAQHADSPLLADSGKRFKSGKAKTKVRLLFEAAFDAKGTEMGISDPSARRVD